jgi:cobalamin biosynthesis protein CobC
MTVGDRIAHGGNLDEARLLFPDAPQPWIDLSTGINPIPYPIGEIPEAAYHRLPSPGELAELERVAAMAYGAPDPGMVVAAPGTQALIQLLPRMRAPSRVAILGPTYAEHALAWRNAGHHVEEGLIPTLSRETDVVVVVNPNNPDGRVLSRRHLEAWLQELSSRDGWLVVDEAFADLEDAESLVPKLPSGAIVLRSFGKTFGLPGIRLGFAVAACELAAGVRSALGPWAVSGPAIAIGRRALADPGWRGEAARARAKDAARFDNILVPVVDRVIGGTRLFRLVESMQSADLFNHFGRHGIWVRRFAEHPHWLRLGLPGTEPEWRRFQAAVDSFEAATSRA